LDLFLHEFGADLVLAFQLLLQDGDPLLLEIGRLLGAAFSADFRGPKPTYNLAAPILFSLRIAPVHVGEFLNAAGLPGSSETEG
jgi:hypothetical protein